MTTQLDPQLDPFETRVLTALQAHVAERSAAPDAAPASRRTTSWWLTAGAAAAAIAVAGVVLLPGVGTGPAYSVQKGNAGEIHVEINRPEDAAGLERALEEEGIAADITYLSDLQRCAPGRYTPVDRRISGLRTAIAEDHLEITLPPGAVRAGETFVLAWSVVPATAEELADGDQQDGVRTVDGHAASVDFNVAAGSVAPCEPVPAG